MYVIAISGWKRSGKDTVATQLIQDYDFKRLSFADPLKDMAALEYGVPREHFDDPQFKEAPIKNLPVKPTDAFTEKIQGMLRRELIDGCWTPRALAILKGSINRAVKSDYWVSKVIEKIKSATVGYKPTGVAYMSINNLPCKFVISDLRYRSEVKQLREAFGNNLITIRVNRFSDVNTKDPSERDLDNQTFDYIIENSGTLEELKHRVSEVIKNVGCGQSKRTVSGAW